MSGIEQAEDAIIAHCKNALGDKVKTVESLPGGWTLDMLNRALQMAPCVFVAYQGSDEGADEFKHKGRFTIYTVSKGATEPQRRRGNSRIMGAYDMVDILLGQIAILTVPDAGKVNWTSVDNLFRDAMFEMGGTVYGIQLTVANMPLSIIDKDELNDFLSVAAEHQVGDADTPNPTDEYSVRSS